MKLRTSPRAQSWLGASPARGARPPIPADIVPPRFRAVVWLNPLTYLVEAYRSVMVARQPVGLSFAVFAAGAAALFAAGAIVCARYKDVIVDFE